MDIIGIGGPEFFLLLLLAGIVLGPQRIVKVSREAGKLMRQVQGLTRGISQELSREIDMLNHEIQHGKSVSSPDDPALSSSVNGAESHPVPEAYQKFREDFPDEGELPAPKVSPPEDIS